MERPVTELHNMLMTCTDRNGILILLLPYAKPAASVSKDKEEASTAASKIVIKEKNKTSTPFA